MGGFQPLGTLLPGALRRAKIEPAVSATQTLRRYRELVAETLGPAIAHQIVPRSLRAGTLTIAAQSHGLLAELRLHESVWLAALQGNKKQHVVARIRYELFSSPTG